MDYSPWGHTESDTADHLSTPLQEEQRACVSSLGGHPGEEELVLASLTWKGLESYLSS